MQPPAAPGKWASLALAIGMHLLLAAFLFFGVRWQIQVPVAVSVDLVAAPQEIAAPPAPTPAPEPEPEPPPPPKPLPKVEPPPPPKPDIAVKAKKPEPKKPEPKKVDVKPEPPRPDPMKERLARESRQLEQKKLHDAMAKDLETAKAQARAQATAGQATARDAWAAKIRGKVRGNIVLPPDVRGNPEAVFEISLLPSGEVLNVRLSKSSGLSTLDAAIERAILKSSPLPKPDQPEVFERNLNLQFRPLEN